MGIPMGLDTSISDRSSDGLPHGTGRTVYLETFGCQMNVLDSQLVRDQLRALGYGFVNHWKDADIVLYNTCSVRAHAEQKVWSRVGLVGKYKQEHPGIVLGVIGCMAERQGTQMLRQYPQIDLLCGPGELDKIPLLIDNVVKTRVGFSAPLGRRAQVALQGNAHRRSGALSEAGDNLETLDLSRSVRAKDVLAEHRCAYVRITRGCNKFCTFCVVPHTRGAEVHRPPDHIVDECKRLVDAGTVEITLLGQTVNHYHFDRSAVGRRGAGQWPQVGRAIGPNQGNSGPSPIVGSRVTTFADLLYRIHEEVPALQRLRFVTSFPRDFGDDILEVMRSCPRICRYLHLPVQSGSNRILQLMNRGYTVEQYGDLLERVREHLPDCEIATDIICGFPTETEGEHRVTADLLRWGRFKNAFIFKYSPRPGTTAHDRFQDDVPEQVKRRRNNELLKIQSEVSAQVHAAYVGRTMRVFVESISAKARRSQNTADPSVDVGWERPEQVIELSGRTAGDLIVVFEGDPSLVGTILEIQIERSAPLTLFGRVVDHNARILATTHSPLAT